MGLGSARLVPLEDARGKAQHYRALLAGGNDPGEERLKMLVDEQSAKDRLRTLEQVCEEYVGKRMNKRSPGHQQRVRQLLRDNILTKETKLGDKMVKVGTLPIQRVTRAIILKDCGFENLWNEQYPSARDLRSPLDKIYGYAREKGYYIGNSPMAWRGGLEHVLQAPRDVHKVKHRPAVNFRTAPTFLQQHLRKHRYRRAWPIGMAPDGSTINGLMIELALFTGTRVGEIIGAEWGEINFATRTWTVRWENTKRKEPGRPHRMPITPSMLRIFKVMEQMCTDPSPQAPIFPSHHKRWVQSHRRVGPQTLNRVVKKLAPEFGEEFSNHGFRTTLKNWWKARHPMALYELQIHHKEPNKTKEAYDDDDDQLEERRPIMEEWDTYLNSAPLPAKQADNVDYRFKERRKA
jgi:integrase